MGGNRKKVHSTADVRSLSRLSSDLGENQITILKGELPGVIQYGHLSRLKGIHRDIIASPLLVDHPMG